jgi:hypothetical protein
VRKLFTSERGAIPVFEVALLVLVLGVLGVAGYRVYTEKYTAPGGGDVKVEKKAESKTVQDPYAGWKDYTTKYDKIKLKYPSDLTLVDESEADTENVTPGSDHIRLTNANGFEFRIQTGLHGIGGACEECTVDHSEPVMVLGEGRFLNFVNRGAGGISGVVVGANNTDWFGASLKTKNITIVDTGGKAASDISFDFRTPNNLIVKPLQEYKTDHFVKEAKLILQSMTY